jgi:hypothetical protein
MGVKHDMHFTAGIWYDNALRMNNYTVRLWMTTNSDNVQDQNTAFERIKYFVYTQIDNTIFINQTAVDQCNQLVRAGLDITTMPGEPVDQIVGIMLYYKLNAITEDRMIIVETELSSSQGENVTYLHSDFETSTGYEKPSWWTTSDLTHSDVVPTDSEKIVSMSQGIAWRDLEMSWQQLPDTDATGNIVVFADFKPANEIK